MEINSAIDLMQNLTTPQQFTDSQDNIEMSRELQFEEVLAKELVAEPPVLKMPSQELPSNGNELPLDLVPSASNAEESLEIVIKPQLTSHSELQKDEKAETPENVDLSSFLMTRLTIETPNTALQLPMAPTHKAFQMEPAIIAADPLTAPMVVALNQPFGEQTVESEQQRVMETLVSLTPSQDSVEEEVKLSLNDTLAGVEEYQAVKLIPEEKEKTEVSTPEFIESLQMQLSQSNANTPETTSTLLELKPLQKEPTTIERSDVLFDHLQVNKEPLKQTMSLPNTGQFDDQFAEIFEQKLMDNVNWMVRRNENSTQIQIDPPELGRIEISIEQNDDKTDIRFFAQVDQTRQLIENTLDKLKLQFAQSGMELGHVDVNSDNQGTYSQNQRLKEPVYQSKLDEPLVNTMAQQVSNQLLDLYI